MSKFRAFYEDKMYGVKAVIWTSRGLHVTLDEGNKAGRRVRGAVLMQSTGLFDVNGKEIFEGDVVKFNDTWDEYCCEGYVEGCLEGENFAEIIKTADGWGFGKTKFPDSSLFYFLEEERMTFSEIVESNDFNMVAIGNIHQNPELIEEVNNVVD